METAYRMPLTRDELDGIQALLGELAGRFEDVEDPDFQRLAPIYAHELPRSVRQAFNEFKIDERSAVFVVSGYPMDPEKIGRTPDHWKNREGARRVFEESALLVLFGSLLGDLIGWATQQDGTVVHDILPIQGHEKEQLGSGSEELLTWHTEDAFHPYRGDYLGMMCIRNPDGVPTTVCTIDELELAPEHLEVLFQPRFVIRPDESHLIKNRGREDNVEDVLEESYGKIEQMNTEPDRIPVLFGDPGSPYMRLDPYFMDHLDDDPEAQAALDALIEQIDGKLGDVVLEAGELCFIDNFRAVHGRKPFKARYDGWDRWLKRVNIARDLRKSRSARRAAGDRIIF